jgi:MSHA biogenesis protein MshQ
MNIRFLLVLVFVFVIAACGGGGGNDADHIAISFPSSSALTCETLVVTLVLHDSYHNPVNVDQTETVIISSPSSLDSLPSSASVTSGNSSGTFNVSHSSALAGVNINVSADGGNITDGVGNEDLDIDFVEAAFRFYADASNIDTTPIATQIGGKTNSQTLELRAIEANSDTGACEAAIEGARNVEIAYECENPIACSSSKLNFTGNSPAIAVTGSANQGTFDFSSVSSNFTTVPMTFNAYGEAGFSFVFNDVGKIKLHAKSALPSSGPTLTGSSNDFVVRPFGLHVYAVDDTAAVDGEGGAFKKVGEGFSIGVKGVLYDANDDSNADGIPNGYPGSDPANYADLSTDNAVALNFGNETIGEDVTLTVEHRLPSAGTLGTFAGGTEVTSFTSGAGTNNSDATYSKVGLIDIVATIKDGFYLGVDTTSGAHIIYGNSGYVGRFTPDHYELSVGAGIFDTTCNNFTYIGQPFSYATGKQPTITVTAKDSAGNTLQNYLGLSGGEEGFKKLISTSMEPMDLTTPVTVTSNNIGADAATAMPVTAVYQLPSVADDSLAYLTVFTLNASDSFTYTRNANAEVVDYEIDLLLSVIDVEDDDEITAVHAAGWLNSDGVNIGGLPIDTTNPFVVTMTAPGEKQFFGRFRLENAFGPETAPLALPVNIEYLGVNGFIINGIDGCTPVVTADNFDLNVIDDDAVDDDGDAATDDPISGDITDIVIDGSSTTGTIANAPFDGGVAGFSFSAPGAGGTAAIEVQLLDTANDYPWLRYNWDNIDQLSDGDMFDDLPSSTAIFGRFRGHDKIIYWQEATD